MPVRSVSLALLLAVPVAAQKPLYDEAGVPHYELPDPLAHGEARVTTAAAWSERRAVLLRMFEEHVYGRIPNVEVPLRVDVVDEDDSALGGAATRRQVIVRLGTGDLAVDIDLLVYLPNERSEPVPAFLGLNFKGNHTVHADPAIRVPTSWVPTEAAFDAEDHRASAAARGKRADRWPIERIVERGYAVATAYYGDIDPDFDDGFGNGVHPLLDGETRDEESFGAIAAWAWGLSRLLDALMTMPDIDGARVAVLGHSRLGKTALWAGARDPRFALVVSNDSGCGGAALSRRCFGETVGAITRRFPHWFCARFASFAGREAALPIDQHELIALIAPRPVYVASAAGDRWADPKGEFLAAKAAEPVYALFGLKGIQATAMPEAEEWFTDGAVGYHLREGGHDLTAWDWERFGDFADRHLTEDIR